MQHEFTRRALLSAGIVTLPGIIIAGDVFHRGRRLCSRCCLPDYGYEQSQFSPPVTGSSLPVVASSNVFDASTDATATTATVARKVKAFQIAPRDLESAQCRVSRVVVTLDNAGFWSVNLDATQSPALLAPEFRPPAERFHRNEFRLEVRPVLLITTPLAPDESATGQPEITDIPAQLFWLNKGEQRHVVLSGHSADVQRSFPLIEQTNVCFSWR